MALARNNRDLALTETPLGILAGYLNSAARYRPRFGGAPVAALRFTMRRGRLRACSSSKRFVIR